MSESERVSYEAAEKEKRLQEREAALLKNELAAAAKAALLESGLSPTLSELTNPNTANIDADIKQQVNSLKAAIDAAARVEITKRLAGKTPPVATALPPQNDTAKAAAQFKNALRGIFD